MRPMLPSNAQLYMMDPSDRTTALRRVAALGDDEPRRAVRSRLRAMVAPRRAR